MFSLATVCDTSEVLLQMPNYKYLKERRVLLNNLNIPKYRSLKGSNARTH